MTPEQRRSLCMYRLECSKESMKAANNLFKEELLRDTANRIYYALFYSVSALALAHGFQSSKHTALQSWYNKEIVRNGFIDEKLGRLYNLAAETRTRGDYKDFVKLDKNKITTMLQQVEPFIERICELMLNKLNAEDRNLE